MYRLSASSHFLANPAPLKFLTGFLEFMSLVWPIQRWLITTLLWWLSDDIFIWWPITGCILYSLFDVLWLHCVCHSLVHSWLTQVNRSLTGNFISMIGSSSPALAGMSALSFPLIPTWLGIQQKVIDLPLFEIHESTKCLFTLSC